MNALKLRKPRKLSISPAIHSCNIRRESICIIEFHISIFISEHQWYLLIFLSTHLIYIVSCNTVCIQISNTVVRNECICQKKCNQKNIYSYSIDEKQLERETAGFFIQIHHDTSFDGRYGISIVFNALIMGTS